MLSLHIGNKYPIVSISWLEEQPEFSDGPLDSIGHLFNTSTRSLAHWPCTLIKTNIGNSIPGMLIVRIHKKHD